MNSDFYTYLIKASIYLIAFILSSWATSSVVWSSFLNPKKPQEAMLFFLLISLALTYLVGSLFINILGVDLWLKN